MRESIAISMPKSCALIATKRCAGGDGGAFHFAKIHTLAKEQKSKSSNEAEVRHRIQLSPRHRDCPRLTPLDLAQLVNTLL